MPFMSFAILEIWFRGLLALGLLGGGIWLFATRQQVTFVTRCVLHTSPAVLA